MRFPRTIRLDDSDGFTFPRAAEPGEWAVSGAFAFAGRDPAGIDGKDRQAFANGFLGTTSFGWSTLVAVAEMPDSAFDALVDALARHFVAHYGAPDLDAARPAAREETEFAADLCEHGVNTLIAVERSFGEDGIRERFRTVQPPRGQEHAKIWEIVAEDG